MLWLGLPKRKLVPTGRRRHSGVTCQRAGEDPDFPISDRCPRARIRGNTCTCVCYAMTPRLDNHGYGMEAPQHWRRQNQQDAHLRTCR